MTVVGFALIGIGAILWNMCGIELFTIGLFQAQAGNRMRRGGPEPSFMKPFSTKDERIQVGKVGIVFGCFKLVAGTVMLGSVGVLALRDWQLWGEKLSVLGESSSPFLELLGLFVASVTAPMTYLDFGIQRDRFASSEELPQREVRTGSGPRVAPSRWRGLPFIAAGIVLCAGCVALCLYLTVQVFFIDPPPYIEIVPLVVFLSAPVYVVGLNTTRKGRRHLVSVVTDIESLADDSFILYLRRFKEDDTLDRAYPRIGSPFLFHFLISGASEEEQLANVLKPYGRLIAAGDPIEGLPRVGADRFYLPLEEWQAPVRELISKARLVVLSLGMGEGTLWEMVEAMSILPPERLIMLVPMDEERYEAFRGAADKRLRARARDIRGTGKEWTPPVLPEYRKDPRTRHLDLEEAARFVNRRKKGDSYVETMKEGLGVGLNSAFLNRDIRSTFKAVIYYPRSIGEANWGEPQFSLLASDLLDSQTSNYFRDPRYLALRASLRTPLRRAFPD